MHPVCGPRRLWPRILPSSRKNRAARDKAVADAFILNHDGNGEDVAGCDFERRTPKRAMILFRCVRSQRYQHQGAVAQKGNGLLHLRGRSRKT